MFVIFFQLLVVNVVVLHYQRWCFSQVCSTEECVCMNLTVPYTSCQLYIVFDLTVVTEIVLQFVLGLQVAFILPEPFVMVSIGGSYCQWRLSVGGWRLFSHKLKTNFTN